MRKLSHGEFLEKLLLKNKHYKEGSFKVLGLYNGTNNKILVEDKYGKCLVLPKNLLKGQGTNSRGAVNKTEYFINMAREIYGEFYDYSDVVVVSHLGYLKIICRLHGVFHQTKHDHLSGRGCPKCGYNKSANSKRMSKKEFVQRSSILHNYKYDYSSVSYIRGSKHVDIICKEHGKFRQTPNKHLNLGRGCPKCGEKASNEKKRKLPKKLANLSLKLRSGVRRAVKKGRFIKDYDIKDVVGCSVAELKEYLDNSKYGFNTEIDGLDVDHIIPVSDANVESDVISLNHYTNLHLLPAYYNRHIKIARKWNPAQFEKWLQVYQIKFGLSDYSKKLTMKDVKLFYKKFAK